MEERCRPDQELPGPAGFMPSACCNHIDHFLVFIVLREGDAMSVLRDSNHEFSPTALMPPAWCCCGGWGPSQFHTEHISPPTVTPSNAERSFFLFLLDPWVCVKQAVSTHYSRHINLSGQAFKGSSVWIRGRPRCHMFRLLR